MVVARTLATRGHRRGHCGAHHRERDPALLGHPDRTLRIDAARITVATVEKVAFHDFIPLRANVVALNTIYLDALEGGRVERVLAEAGDLVTAGQPSSSSATHNSSWTCSIAKAG